MKLIRFEPVPLRFGLIPDYVGTYNDKSVGVYIDRYYVCIYQHKDNYTYQRVYEYNHRRWFKRWLDFINPFR